MRKRIFLVLLAGLSSPAMATGGMVCKTGGARPIEVRLGFGHVAGAGLIADALRLRDDGRDIPVTAPQWWLDDSEMRLVLTDRNATRRELVLKASRHGRTYDGSLWRKGQRRWVRCREA